jgi:hypothetical protein
LCIPVFTHGSADPVNNDANIGIFYDGSMERAEDEFSGVEDSLEIIPKIKIILSN